MDSGDLPKPQLPPIRLSTMIIPRGQFETPSYPMTDPIKRAAFADADKRAQETGERRRVFWNMLVRTIPGSGYVPPQTEQTQILDLACGMAEEAFVLNSYFGGSKFGSSNDSVKVWGIDTDNRSIDLAKLRYRSDPTSYEFIAGDATQLETISQLPDQVDVVMIRHQHIAENEQTWRNIFEQGLGRLKPTGVMVITSYEHTEHEKALEVLQNLNTEIVADEINQEAAPISPSNRLGLAIDKHMAVVRPATT